MFRFVMIYKYNSAVCCYRLCFVQCVVVTVTVMPSIVADVDIR